MHKTLLFLLILCSYCTACVSNKQSNQSSNQQTKEIYSISENDVSNLYQSTLENANPRYFVTDKNETQYSPYPLGTYIAGFKGILLYSHFPKALNEYLQQKKIACPDGNERAFNLANIECLTGNQPFIAPHKEFQPFGLVKNKTQEFHHYNPVFITWVIDHLIPEPSSAIGEKSAQNYYDTVFSRFFRMMASAYVYLLEHDYETEVSHYQNQFQDLNFNGFYYLLDKYKQTLPEYAQAYDYTITNMNGALAIGFWLRRNIDKTDKQLWMGLSRFMLKYDKVWFTTNVSVKHYR